MHRSVADVCTEPFGENNFIAGIIIGMNTTTVPNQITTVDNVETNTSAGVINEYSETVHQESTQVQVMADATNLIIIQAQRS